MLTEDDLARFYDELAEKLTNFLMANGGEYAAVCDIVQETFVRLWNKRADFSPDESVSGFVFAVAKNLRIDDFRRHKSTVALDENTAAGLTAPAAGTADSDVDYLRERIQAALAELPDDLRNAYTLFQIADRSIKEIAALAGASESSVKVRIHRAKEKLQHALADLESFV